MNCQTTETTEWACDARIGRVEGRNSMQEAAEAS
jgi:hypothetical protein